MKKIEVKTDKAPAAVGPYSQAIKYGDFVFTSGQLAINPEDGSLLTDDIKEATKLVFKNLAAVLEAAGSSLDKAIKLTVYLADINDFAAVNEVYKENFSGVFPARSAFEVANLPLGGTVEIEAIASL